MTIFNDDPVHSGGEQHHAGADGNRRKQQRKQQKPQKLPKQQPQQPRQLLSCTKCRERKVKCDRTKPCVSCCARGHPKECHFVAIDGDYAPISQAYEIRKLRSENMRLKEQLSSGKVSIDDDDSDHANSSESQPGDRANSLQNRRAAKQKRFQASEWQDSLYFGYPSYHAVLKDFSAINMNPGSASSSLTHLMPRGAEMFSSQNPPTYPFPTMFPANPVQCIPALLSCLPSREELLDNLTSFEKRVSGNAFPHMPAELSKSEVERFLSDPRKNAQMSPDMLAFLFAALALGCQHSAWDKAGGQWDVDVMNAEMRKGEVYIAAAMQGLRLASFMQKSSLLGIQALVMIGPWLTNSGRFLDAWSLFGLTIRLAQSIGLHRHPKYLDPAPPTQKECSVRQTIWWWMLRMDEQYSMTLGRPLGISGIGDCPWPHQLTTDPTVVRFSEFMNHFTILGRQILSSDRLTPPKIDEYTDSLKALLETMPETIQFNESWQRQETEVPEWPLGAMAAMYHCKTHSYLILLNRQRTEKHPTKMDVSTPRTPNSSFRVASRATSSFPSTPSSTKGSLRGRPLVLSSAEEILDAFLFFYRRVPAALIDWGIGQQAFNACMIILLDALENRQITNGTMKAEVAYSIFKELEEHDVHKLAGLAIEKISWALQELPRVVKAAANESAMPDQTGAPNETGHTAGPLDTVMGNTGMLLLEDPGLQAFAQETWTPITWGMPDMHPHMTKPAEDHYQDEPRPMELLKSENHEDELGSFRSVDSMHDMRRSVTMRSAPSRYPTPSDDEQQLCFSDTSSNTGLGLSQHNFMDSNMRDHRERQASQEFTLLHAPQILQSSPAVESMASNSWEYEMIPSSRTPIHDGSSLTPPMMQHQISPVQFRHNSCPSVPELPFDPALRRPRYSSPGRNGDRPSAPQMLRGTPLRSSVTATMGTDQTSFQDYMEAFSQNEAPVEIANGTTPMPARAAGPMFSMADASGTNYLPTTSTNRMPLMGSRVQHNMVPGQSYPFASRSSDAGLASMPTFTETVSLEDWQRRMGIGGGV